MLCRMRPLRITYPRQLALGRAAVTCTRNSWTATSTRSPSTSRRWAVAAATCRRPRTWPCPCGSRRP